jgi:hypothetical protein
MRQRPMQTHELAFLCGVTSANLLAWARDGRLKLAPKAKSGHSQGRGHEMIWSAAAVTEAIEWSKQPRPTGVNLRFKKQSA